MRDFPRPAAVDVKIFGKAHKLHRLTYADVFELLGQVTDSLKDNLEARVKGKIEMKASVMLAIETGGPLVREILKRSFPTFQEWDDLPAGYATGLLEAIAEENDLPGIIENFSQLRDKVTQALLSRKS